MNVKRFLASCAMTTLLLAGVVSPVSAQTTETITKTTSVRCYTNANCVFTLPPFTESFTLNKQSDTATLQMRFGSNQQFFIVRPNGTKIESYRKGNSHKIDYFGANIGDKYTFSENNSSNVYAYISISGAKSTTIEGTYIYFKRSKAPTVKAATTTQTTTPQATVQPQALPETGGPVSVDSLFSGYVKSLAIISGAALAIAAGVYLKNYGRDTMFLWSIKSKKQ